MGNFGGICYYCHWGWPIKVATIYQRACALLDDPTGYYFTSGPSHVVWADENFATEHTRWCLDHFDDYWDEEWREEVGIVIKWSLLALENLSDEEKDGVPDDYDGQHPDLFPPSMEFVSPSELP